MVYLNVAAPCVLMVQASEAGLHFRASSPTTARLVTHLDIRDEDITPAVTIMDTLRQR